jgi:molecular chaperone GrpE
MPGSHDFDPNTAWGAGDRSADQPLDDPRAPRAEAPLRNLDLELDLDLDLPGEVEARRRMAEQAARAASPADAAAGETPPAQGPPAAGVAEAAAGGSAETSAEAAAGPIRAAGDQDLAAAMEQLQAEVQLNREKWLRAMAELENFRKRTRREMESSILFANANLLRELLEVLDNFERALSAPVGGENGPGNALAQGVRLIYERFRDILRQNGVVRIDAVAVPFDPNLHEAISQVESEGVPSHHVVEVAQAGYLLKDMVLRPARVVVAK